MSSVPRYRVGHINGRVAFYYFNDEPHCIRLKAISS